MSSTSTIIIVLILIIVGLNMTANNTFISLIVTYIFYKDTLGKKLLRLLGAIIALSSIFFILRLPQYGIFINILVVFILAFLSIRGHNNAMRERAKIKERLLKEYQNEIKQKRERIEALKHQDVEKSTPPNPENLTPNEIRKKIWNDGSITNKELIKGFTEEK